MPRAAWVPSLAPVCGAHASVVHTLSCWHHSIKSGRKTSTLLDCPAQRVWASEPDKDRVGGLTFHPRASLRAQRVIQLTAGFPGPALEKRTNKEAPALEKCHQPRGQSSSPARQRTAQVSPLVGWPNACLKGMSGAGEAQVSVINPKRLGQPRTLGTTGPFCLQSAPPTACPLR